MWVLFGHLDGPDAGTRPYIEDTLRAVERSEVQVAAGEEQGDMVFDIDPFELLLQDRRSASREGESQPQVKEDQGWRGGGTSSLGNG